MRKGDIKYILLGAAVNLCFCTVLLCASQPPSGSITVELPAENMEGGTEGPYLYCINVASYENGEYRVKDEYKDLGLDFACIGDAASLQKAAEKLEGRPHTDPVTKKTDNAGRAKFESLSPGIYLIQAPARPGQDLIKPSLVFIPSQAEDGNEMCFDVTVRPKHSKVGEGKKASPPKTGEDDSEGYYYLTSAMGAAVFCGIISAPLFKKKKVLDNHKPYGTIKK